MVRVAFQSMSLLGPGLLLSLLDPALLLLLLDPALLLSLLDPVLSSSLEGHTTSRYSTMAPH